MWTCESNGVAHPDHEMLLLWEQHSHDSFVLAILKGGYLTSDTVPIEIRERWPSPCVDLIIAFNTFIDPLKRRKQNLAQYSPADRDSGGNVFATNAVQHYMQILQFFDTAIEALDKPDTRRAFDLDDDGFDVSASACTTPTQPAAEPTFDPLQPHRRAL
ncbi:hypothetical protein EST38_g4919 [Candolleomyces aberdarensis]|uniref:Uncharacterized protein n=1 Tax=Candolleomyces aberdarensis TaxID=2316362 RepID=A0A4Q2DLT8_9AGAR|nr:hypothetical protein EST38_g4919 [Candolleomyces aberdarensis]